MSKLLSQLKKTKSLNDIEFSAVEAGLQGGHDLLYVLQNTLGKTEHEAYSLIASALRAKFVSKVGVSSEGSDLRAVLGDDYLRENRIWLDRDIETNTARLFGCDLTRPEVFEEINFFIEEPIEAFLTSRQNLRALQREIESKEDPAKKGQTSPAESSSKKADSRAAKFVERCLEEALVTQASDIHFLSGASGLQVKFRRHGLLAAASFSHDVAEAAVFARLKVLADVNVSEKRRPQDGRFSRVVDGKEINFRVSFVPTAFGESIVVRPLDPTMLQKSWEELGFEAETLSAIQNVLSEKHGLFIVTGPTGAGKSTTLYTALQHLNSGQRKIITVEDPVEYRLEGIDQVQVNDSIGLTFASTLRSILRQDPNVIMVGEIRDQETAQIACRAALVGRLVLATLHTNSAASAYTRLVDLGVEPFIVKDVLKGVLGQELRIQMCEVCSGAGCPECNNVGATGRSLYAELLSGDAVLGRVE